MSQSTREEVILQLDRVDTALEAPEADKTAILREAVDWLAEHPPKQAADALYYRDRLDVIRERHGAA
ncbi:MULTISPECIES: hypothetical protein [unclassified Pseudoxanthomonas]|uniref:hypothetical protein n=1 Tax=unclassified Pseudoxanthomonas TaxID=2645906 RepID=UPI0008F0E120|nr:MULTISPECIES: hypothetical protein [unclassified Pseudoxanthomonas]PPJ43146.1 hypothetical protein C0063_08000 [Pseudoxanthomonas sp. KAs_5_3]SFV34312.1 hypothetical protein SAMN05428990_2672 [Pseudoxanthomonas sp. YR558]